MKRKDYASSGPRTNAVNWGRLPRNARLGRQASGRSRALRHIPRSLDRTTRCSSHASIPLSPSRHPAPEHMLCVALAAHGHHATPLCRGEVTAHAPHHARPPGLERQLRAAWAAHGHHVHHRRVAAQACGPEEPVVCGVNAPELPPPPPPPPAGAAARAAAAAAAAACRQCCSAPRAHAQAVRCA